MLTLLPKGVKKKVKNFLIEDFFHLPLVSMVVHLELRVQWIFREIWNGHYGKLRGWGEITHEKTEVENLLELSL